MLRSELRLHWQRLLHGHGHGHGHYGHPVEQDRGAVFVVTCLVVVTMLGVVSLVVDLGHGRQTKVSFINHIYRSVKPHRTVQARDPRQ